MVNFPISNRCVLCGLLLFVRARKCKQHNSRAGNRQHPSKLVLLEVALPDYNNHSTISDPCEDTKRAFKGQSSGLQLACPNHTSSLNTRLLHSYSNDESEPREHLMEPHSPLVTGFVSVLCMYVFLMRAISYSWVGQHRTRI